MLSNIINQMSSIINSGVSAVIAKAPSRQQTKTVETIIFNNLNRVNISHRYISGDICEALVFPASELPSTTISYESLQELFKVHRPGFDLSGLEQRASEHTELINGALAEYPKEIQEILRADILDLTHYFQYNLEYWDITQLCLKYDIAPVDIFVALVADAAPFGMGAFAFPATGNHGLAEKARADFQEKLNSPDGNYWSRTNDIHFDYWNGVGVKNSFPKDITKNPMQVNIRRYNERNDDLGYYRIIQLFATQLAGILEQQSANIDSVDSESVNI